MFTVQCIGLLHADQNPGMAQRGSCKIRYHQAPSKPIRSVLRFGVINYEITCYVPFHNENRHRFGLYNVKYISRIINPL